MKRDDSKMMIVRNGLGDICVIRNPTLEERAMRPLPTWAKLILWWIVLSGVAALLGLLARGLR